MKRSNKTYLYLIAILLTSLLAGCVGGLDTEVMERDINARLEEREAFTTAKIEQATNRPSLNEDKGNDDLRPSRNLVVYDRETIWLGRYPITTEVAEQLPPVFDKNCTLNYPERVSFATVVERLSRHTRIRINVNPDVFIRGVDLNFKTGSSSKKQTNNSLVKPIVTNDVYGEKDDLDSTELTLNYINKPVVDIFNSVASRAGVNWRYKDGVVTFYRFETRAFQIKARPGKTTVTNAYGQADDQSTSTSSSDVTRVGGVPYQSNTATKTTMAFSVWEDLARGLDAVRTNLGRYSINESSGTVIITDTPDALAVMEKYITKLNTLISKQVVIDVQVVRIASKATKDMGLDWDFVFNELSSSINKNWGLQATSAVAKTITGSGSLSSAIVPVDPLNPEKFEGSSFFLKALETQGTVSVDERVPITTNHNQPASIAIIDEYTYLAKTAPASGGTGDGTGTPGLEPGVVTTGFTMNLIPTILANNDIMLELSMSISTLQDIKTVSSGAYSIQTPEIQKQGFFQRVNLKPSQTIVLTAYERSIDQFDKRGVDKDTIVFGGDRGGRRQRVTVLLMITPRIIEGS